MKRVLYLALEYMAIIHDRILMLNDSYSTTLNDKQLHFLVIGLAGMLLFFFFHPIFKALIRHGHEIVVSWFYVFTLVIVITFAIEIGQRISNTGTMEFFDMVYGIAGFFWMFAVFAFLRAIVRGVLHLIRKRRKVVETAPTPAESEEQPEPITRGRHER